MTNRNVNRCELPVLFLKYHHERQIHAQAQALSSDQIDPPLAGCRCYFGPGCSGFPLGLGPYIDTLCNELHSSLFSFSLFLTLDV